MKLHTHKLVFVKLSRLMIGVILLYLSGCVYLRLLELKNQFEEFDQYIEITTDSTFSLFFKEPVLHKDDIITLSRLNPTRKIILPDGEEWVYHFVKQYKANAPDQQNPVSLIFRFKFDKQGNMQQWYFPNEFIAMVPPEFLEASLRSLGNATIFKLSRQLKAEVTQLKTEAKPPSQTSIKQVLGNPFLVQEKDDLQRYIYRFTLLTDWVEDGYEERKIALVKLDFVPQNKLLIKASPRFAGLKISISFSKLLGEDYFSVSNTK